MAEYADLIAWLDRLQRARTSGIRSVFDSDGSRVEYKSDSELASAIAYVQSLLNAPPVKAVRFTTSKGLYR
jgi:hypothetical protein